MNKVNLELYNQQIVRQPIFPLDKLNELPNRLDDLSSFVESILDKEPMFKEALRYASPQLLKRFEQRNSKEKDVRSEALAITKYFMRSVVNTVPFGLFTSYGLTNTASKANTEYSRMSDIDSSIASNYFQSLQKSEDAITHCMLRWNDTIHFVGNKIKFYKMTIDGQNKLFDLSQIDNNEIVNYLIKNVSNSFSFSFFIELIASILEEETKNNIKNFVYKLIESGLILTDLDIELSGIPLIDQLIAKTSRIPAFKESLSALHNFKSDLKNVDQSIINEEKDYKNLNTHLNKLGHNINQGNVSNTILKRNQINLETDKRDLYKILRLVGKLSSKNNPYPIMENFISRFKSRYEEALVPLLEALDPEIGIGFAVSSQNTVYSPLLTHLPEVARKPLTSNIRVNSKIQQFWLELFLANKHGQEIDLKDYDLSVFEGRELSVGTCCVDVSKVAAKGYKIKYVGGTTANHLIGRFTQLDNNVAALADQVAKDDEEIHTKKIIVEIYHNPLFRIGNISARNINRSFEINILSQTHNSDKKKINLSDLYLKASNNQIILWSEEYNAEVLPLLSTAHNFSNNSVPAYHFLAALSSSYSGNNSLGLDFGGLNTNKMTFCPRISYGSYILNSATWNINLSSFRKFLKTEIHDKMDHYGLRQYLRKLHLPRYFILVVNGEQRMAFDLESDITLIILLKELKKLKSLRLEEKVYNTDEVPFANEIISLFKLTKSEKEKKTHLKPKFNIKTKRSFSLGSKWLYFKLYCGNVTADKLLSNYLEKTIKIFLENGTIGKFHFLRYTDPNFHIRLRFYVDDKSKIGLVINSFGSIFDELIEKHIIHKVETGTYYRELERYGFDKICLAEQIFNIDSKRTLELISVINQDECPFDRWLLTIKGINDLVSLVYTSNAAKHRFYQQIFKNFKSEFSGIKASEKIVLTKFRKFESDMESVLNGTKLTPQLEKIFNKRKAELKALNADHTYLQEKLGSFVHMFVNRMTLAQARLHELVLYGLLECYYYSKTKNKTKARANHDLKGILN